MPDTAETRLAELRQLLRACQEFGNSYRGLHDGATMPGCALDIEGRDSMAAPYLDDTFRLSVQLLVASEDHLVSMSRLVVEPLTLFGVQVLTRACLEASGTVWWLMDPAISARARAARFLNERVEALRHSANIAPDEMEANDFRRRLTALWSEVERRGFRVVRDKRERPVAVEEHRPKRTDLISRLLGHFNMEVGETYYRHLCAVAHGTYPGLLESFTFEPSGTPGVLLGTPKHDLVSVEMDAAVSVLSWLLAFDHVANRAGWSAGEMVSWRTHVLGVIKQGLLGRETGSTDG